MNTELYERASAWVEDHRDALVEDIKRLVRIPSIAEKDSSAGPYGQACRDVLDEFLAIGRERGFESVNHEYHCAALWLPEQEGPVEESIGLWGHLDVVPLGDNWVYEPFHPIEKDGYLIGRGSQDNKGPAVGALYAALCLRDLGVQLRHPLRIYGGCNEETGMEDLIYFTKHYPCPALSIIPDSGFPVCFAEKGSLTANLVSDRPAGEDILGFSGGVASNMVPDTATITLRASESVLARLDRLPGWLEVSQSEDKIVLTARGVSRHAAFPNGAENAIAALTRGVAAAGILPEEDEAALLFLSLANLGFGGKGLGIACEDEISGPLTCVGSMCSLDGERRMVLHLNIRYPVEADSAALIQSIQNACAAHGFRGEILRDSKPNHFPREHPVVETLTGVFQEITGSSKGPFAMGGGTYARKLPNALGFGMGMPDGGGDRAPFQPGHGGAHEPDEGLYIADLLAAIKIYCAALPEVDKLEF